MHFPPRYARVDGESITLRGVVIDTEGVSQVYVNGQAVDTEDNFATWTYTASLVPGENELIISEETSEGTTEIDRIFVERAGIITTPAYVVDDHANNRLLILDTTRNSIIAADKDSGSLLTLSPPPATTNQLVKPRGLALDSARNRLLVFQGRAELAETHPEFMAIDLTTGEQSVFNAPDFSDIYLAHFPRSMVTAGDIAYVSDVQFEYVDAAGNEVGEDADWADFRAGGIIYSINLDTGARTVVSSRYVPEPEGSTVEHPLIVTRSIAYNPINSTIYALDTGLAVPRLLAVNVADGKRTVMALTDDDEKAFSLRAPQMLAMDVTGQQLYLLNDTASGDVTDPAVAKIDVATKVAAYLTANSLPKDGDYLLSQTNGFTYSTDDNALYLLEDTQDAVFKVNTETGVRNLAAATGPVDAKNHISNNTLHDVFFRDDHQTYLLDGKFSSVFGYNLYFGSKDILNNSATNDLEPNQEILRTPGQGTWDPINQKMLLANRGNGVLVAFDPATRSATNEVDLRAVAVDMLTDEDAGLTYVALSGGIIQVDLNDEYNSKFLSATGVPDQTNIFSNIRGIALDTEGERLLVADSNLNAILAVDTATGARTYFSAPSSSPTAADVLTLPRAIVIDKSANRALILDTGRKAILAADLATGEREVIYEYAETTPRELFNPTQMAMHPTFNYLLLLDSITNSLVALDLAGESPQLVMLTR